MLSGTSNSSNLHKELINRSVFSRPAGRGPDIDLTPNFFSRRTPAESACLDKEIVPSELAVSLISSIVVPSLYKFNADSDRGTSRFLNYQLR